MKEPDVLYIKYAENEERIDLLDLFTITSFDNRKKKYISKELNQNMDYYQIVPTFDKEEWLSFNKKHKNLLFESRYAYPTYEYIKKDKESIHNFQPNIIHTLFKHMIGDREYQSISVIEMSLEDQILHRCFPDFWEKGVLNNSKRTWNVSDIDEYFNPTLEYDQIKQQITSFLDFFKNPIKLTIVSKKEFKITMI